MTEAQKLESFANPGDRIPFLRLLGVTAYSVAEEGATVELGYRAELSNSAATFHGGALMSVLDFAMSVAARGVEASDCGVATIDMRTSFLAAVKEDVTVHAVCVQRGKSIAFCEARAATTQGRVVVTSSGTFKLMRKEKGSVLPQG